MPIPSLPRFLYLDEKSLEEYLSVIEEGISDETTRKSLRDGNSTGAPDSSEEQKVVRETVSQRFIRLVSALASDPTRWRYRDVSDMASEFESLAIQEFLHLGIEIEIPPAVQLFSQPEELTSMLDMLDALRPMAPLLGKDLSEMPGENETRAVRDLGKVLKSDVVVVGDQDEGTPKVTGKLNKGDVRDSIDGEVFILGKIIKKWGPEESHSLLALPGASLMSRQQRRQAASQLNTDESTTLRGPAVTLDILAIYR